MQGLVFHGLPGCLGFCGRAFCLTVASPMCEAYEAWKAKQSYSLRFFYARKKKLAKHLTSNAKCIAFVLSFTQKIKNHGN